MASQRARGMTPFAGSSRTCASLSVNTSTLIELDEEVIEQINPIFSDDIDNLYDEAAAGCYFCSKLADPVAERYGERTMACLECTLKLRGFLEAANLNKPAIDKIMTMANKGVTP